MTKKYWLAGLGVVLLGGVIFASSSGALERFGQGAFGRGAELNRAEVVVGVVTAALGEQTETCAVFPDVAEDASYNPYVCAAYEYGIISAYTDGLFRPEDSVTRSETAKLIYKAFGVDYSCPLPLLYSDVEDGAWYTDPVQELGILGVYGDVVKFGGKFFPDSSITSNALDTWLTNAMATDLNP